MRRPFAYAFIAFWLGFWSLAAEARQDDPLPFGMRSDYSGACSASVTCTREVFLDLAFQTSADGTARAMHLHKWVIPFYVSFAADKTTASDEHVEDVEWLLDHLVGSMSSADVDVSREPFPPPADRPSLFVLGFEHLADTIVDAFPELAAVSGLEFAYNSAAELHRADENEICSVGLIWNDAAEIIGGVVLIDLKKSLDDIEICLPNIIASANGFLGRPSIIGLDAALDAEFPQDDLTLFDKRLLQILNNDMIKAGMTREEVKAVFPDVYARYRPWRLQPSIDVEPVDRETLACMASIDCAREHFLEMAVIGSKHEPKTLERRVLVKLEIPTAIALIEGDGIDPDQRKAAAQGFRDVLALAQALRLPVFPLKPHYPQDIARFRAYLSADVGKDRDGAFAPWLASDQQRQQYDLIWDMFETPTGERTGVVCSAWYASYGEVRYGLHSASAAIPTDNTPPEQISRCVVEEIAQSLGLPTDIDSFVDTLFDDRADNQRLTAFDLLMFALLYHPLMESGMREDQVVAVFDRVYQDVWQQFLGDPAFTPIAGMSGETNG